MPTARREVYMRTAIACFIRQHYSPRELVIFDDADIPLERIPVIEQPAENGQVYTLKTELGDAEIRYFRKRPGRRDHSIGALRNLCCDLSSGQLIAHWDDDDYSSSDRLTVQVSAMKRARVELVGLRSMEFYDVDRREGWLYESDREEYALGTSLVYTRALWHRRPFEEDLRLPNGAEQNFGEDNAFIRDQAISTLLAHAPRRLMAARIHGACTSPKPIGLRDPETGKQIEPDEWLRLNKEISADLGELFA